MAGAGAHGQRVVDGAGVPRTAPPVPGGAAWLLIRRHPAPGELAYDVAAGPAATTLAALVRVAGARWGIAEGFQAATNDTGLDPYQVRTYTGWYRHTTVSMLAHALLAVLPARANSPLALASPAPTPVAWPR